MVIQEGSIKKLKTELRAIRSEKAFNLEESVESEITYRSVNCRHCKDCKDDDKTKLISIKQEIEQNLISKSVKVDIKNRVCTTKLPVIHNPLHKLAPNKNEAIAIYNQQIKKLNENPKDKRDVTASEAKLHALSHVCYLRDFRNEVQKILEENPVQNYILGIAVWNKISLTTPCRIVFDASKITESSYRLNEILVKGRYNVSKLVEIFISWTIVVTAQHTDVQKMYFTVKLLQKYWCLQIYLW